MEKELSYLGMVLGEPDRPFVAIIGGAKVSDKIDVIVSMLGRVDRLLIGGAMAYTFFKALGMPVGKSLVEDDKQDAAREVIAPRRRAAWCCNCRSITWWPARSTRPRRSRS